MNQMTGREALDKLQAGFTLRREAWEPDEKCKAYFSDDLWSIRVECDSISPAPEHVPDDPKFADYMSIFDAIDAGEFLMDDWEIVE
jgi:hypothetical protein